MGLRFRYGEFSKGDIVVLPNGFLGKIEIGVQEGSWVYKVWVPRFASVVMARGSQLIKADAITKLAWIGAHG